MCPYKWDRRETVCFQTYDKWWLESRIQGPSEENCVTKATGLPYQSWFGRRHLAQRLLIYSTLKLLYHWVSHAPWCMRTLLQPCCRMELMRHLTAYTTPCAVCWRFLCLWGSIAWLTSTVSDVHAIFYFFLKLNPCTSGPCASFGDSLVSVFGFWSVCAHLWSVYALIQLFSVCASLWCVLKEEFFFF